MASEATKSAHVPDDAALKLANRSPALRFHFARVTVLCRRQLRVSMRRLVTIQGSGLVRERDERRATNLELVDMVSHFLAAADP